MLKLSPGYPTVTQSTTKIFQGDFLEEATLRRTTKKEMTSSFLNTSNTKGSALKTTMEMYFLMDLSKVLLKFIRETPQNSYFKAHKGFFYKKSN